MKRKYELKKRAEQREETRRRIVEAAIDLHRTSGPARTTISAIAEHAGVQRHTVYAHFPDERELGLACSELYMDRNPMPDPDAWEEAEGEARLRLGLTELYRYYAANEQMMANVLRDAEVDELTREMLELRTGPMFARAIEVLAKAVAPRGKRRERVEELFTVVGLNPRGWIPKRDSTNHVLPIGT